MWPSKKKNLQVGEQAGENESVFKDERGFCVFVKSNWEKDKKCCSEVDKIWPTSGEELDLFPSVFH